MKNGYQNFIFLLLVLARCIFSQSFGSITNGAEINLNIPEDEKEIISNLVVLLDWDLYDRNYQSMLLGLDRLAATYSPDSLSLFTRKLELFENQHPFIKLYENKRAGKEGYSSWQPFQSHQFEEYFNEQVELFKQLLKISPGSQLVARKLYESSTFYLTNHANDQAKQFLLWIETEFSDSYYVSKNFVNNRLNSLELQVGEPFPLSPLISPQDEKNETTDESLVMVVYLDIYALDYRNSILNLQQATNGLSDIRYVILFNSELVKDELAHRFTEAAGTIRYVLASEDIKNTLGLSDYSSTILVSPDQRILAKDLKFDELINNVAFFRQSSKLLAKR